MLCWENVGPWLAGFMVPFHRFSKVLGTNSVDIVENSNAELRERQGKRMEYLLLHVQKGYHPSGRRVWPKPGINAIAPLISSSLFLDIITCFGAQKLSLVSASLSYLFLARLRFLFFFLALSSPLSLHSTADSTSLLLFPPAVTFIPSHLPLSL